MIAKRVFVIVLAAGLLAGCQFRSSTTTRTAIEEALLSESAVRTAAQMDFSRMKGKSFFVKDDKFEATDGKFVLGELKNKLMQDGLRAAAKEEEADFLVYPRSGAHGVDDSRFLIGFPSIPIPIPTVGTVETPELALFKLERQRGRDRTSVTVEERETGNLAMDVGPVSAQCRYDRWVILIIFGFTDTNLGEPF